MNIEKSLKVFNNYIKGKDTMKESLVEAIEILLTAYEKEKEKNKRAEELYMQHNQMIIDILKECNYMLKNRYYMNDTAIRQHAEDIKNIAKYYIKQTEWEEE